MYFTYFMIFLFIGIPAAFLVSRLLLILSRRWGGGYGRILGANAVSATLCIIALGKSNFHPLAWQLAIFLFVPSQTLVLLEDLIRHFRTGRVRGA